VSRNGTGIVMPSYAWGDAELEPLQHEHVQLFTGVGRVVLDRFMHQLVRTSLTQAQVISDLLVRTTTSAHV
jgi:hypothetical protein